MGLGHFLCRAFFDFLADHTDMRAQRIDHGLKRKRQGKMAGALFEVVQAFDDAGGLLRRGRGHLILEAHEFGIKFVDALILEPAIEYGREAQKRVHNANNGNEQYQKLLDEDSQPEGKMALQKGRSGFVELAGVGAEGEIKSFWSGELARGVKQTGGRMKLGSGFE